MIKLAVQRKILLGDLLVKAGVITPNQLRMALIVQKEEVDKRLGDILVEMGVMTQEDLINFLGKQLKIPYVDLSKFAPDKETFKLLPKRLIEEYKVIPLRREDNKLVLAMIDPLDIIAIDNISLATKLSVQPVVATEKDITQIIKQYFGEEVDTLISTMRKEEAPALKIGEKVISPDVPIPDLVDSLISRACKLNASDFHLEPREEDVRVRYRVDGVTQDFMPLPKEIQMAVTSRVKVMADMDITETRLPQEGHFKVKIEGRDVDVRVSTIPTLYGEKVALRVFNLSASFLKLDQLGFESEELREFEEIISKPYGMILIAGPTGSGKSTTFYAALNKLNVAQRCIFSLEDPVEYPLKDINQTQVNPKIGLTYASGLQSILRQIPDIVMLGEIRDKDTARFAVEASLAGGLMLSTFHAYDASGAITRLSNMGVELYSICSALIAVISQRLVRILCPACKKAYAPAREEKKRLGIPSDKEGTLYHPQGCKDCYYTGYRGRTGIFEIVKINETIKELITKRAPASSITQAAKESGVTLMRENSIKKVLKGLTTEEELHRIVYMEEI